MVSDSLGFCHFLVTRGTEVTDSAIVGYRSADNFKLSPLSERQQSAIHEQCFLLPHQSPFPLMSFSIRDAVNTKGILNPRAITQI